MSETGDKPASLVQRMWGVLRRRWKGVSALCLILGFVGLNAISFLHARAMTTFEADGERTASPDELSTWQKLQTLVSGVRIPRPRNSADPSAHDLAFKTVMFEARDNTHLEAWDIPAPAAMDAATVAILFHGYASSKSSLLQQARAFHDWGLDVCLVDHRGSGGSSGTVTSLGWHEALDVEAAVLHVRAVHPGHRIILFGSSMGAAAVLRAIHLARSQGQPLDIDAIILEAPFNRMLDTTANRFHQMGLPGFPGAHCLLFWGGYQCGFDAFDHNPMEYIRSVACPGLLIFGAQDTDVTQADRAAIVARAPGRVDHKVLDAAGHPPLLPEHLDLWTRQVGAFLRAEAFVGP